MMNRVNSVWASILMVVLIAGILAGCAKDTDGTEVPAETEVPADNGLYVTASFYPVYAFTSMITDGMADIHVSCLVQPQAGCFRSYTLSDWDTAVAGGADVVILAGRGLEAFESSMYAYGDKGPIVVTSIYNVALTSHSALNDVSGTHMADPNPFIYLTTSGADAMLTAIEAGMATVDPDNEETYLENLSAAKAKIEELKRTIEGVAAEVCGTKVIVMNEAFFGVADEFSLVVEAAWNRESGVYMSESEIDTCMDALVKCDSRIVLIEKQAPQALIQRLSDAGFTVIKLDTMSMISATAGSQGWFDTMYSNTEAIAGGIKK